MQSRCASVLPVALLLVAGAARADDVAPVAPITPAAPTDSLPGSPTPPGLGLSPEAPPVPPAAGGRAPSFGAPTDVRSSSFRIGGRIYGWEAVGVGENPRDSGTALHVPMLSAGKIPFWGGAGGSLNLQYGTPVVTAYVSYYYRVNSESFQGYTNPGAGPAFGTAYLLLTPAPIRTLRLNFRVGAITEVYAGPGQWGWGIFGPMLALRGYGETTNGEWDLTRDARVSFSHGLLVVPGVPEDFARGNYNSYIETGVSNYVNHAHLGIVLKNQYTFKLHYASDHGTDDRKYLTNFLRTPRQDGRMDSYIGEARWQSYPWGQVGLSGGLYDFVHAAAVSDGVWWGVDFTQGAKDMVNKFVGPHSAGNGKVAVVGAEYNFSVSSILWAPRTFTGQAPDLRVAIAAMLTRTVASDDPQYRDMNGYYAGLETEYRMTSLFSLTFQAYGEDRYTNIGTWSVYSLNPGIAFHTDWLSTDRIQLIYGRRFYSRAADPNTAQPLDRNMIALGGYMTF